MFVIRQHGCAIFITMNRNELCRQLQRRPGVLHVTENGHDRGWYADGRLLALPVIS